MASKRIVKIICGFGALTALCCAPPVAAHTYALGPLHPEEVSVLWVGAIGGAVACWLFGRTVASVRPGAVALLVPLIAFTWFEIGLRIALRLAPAQTQRDIAWLAERTFPDSAAVVGHPFLQFLGRPSSEMRGTEFFGNLSAYNKNGFFGRAGEIPKPKDVIRIACLGASTTAEGYPEVMEKQLNEQMKGESMHFEVLNFGLGFWTSAHTVVNYVLNVVYYEPDYVVVLHGWNDERVLGAAPGVFRTDYSHAYKGFDPPLAPDRWLIRTSLAYRWIANKIAPQPQWTSMMEATTKPYPHSGVDVSQYGPFVNNLRTIMQLAMVRGSVPVLATMPHCTDPKTPFVTNSANNMQTFADLTRKLWESELQGYALLVDLDREITGKHNDWFIDAGHMNKTGIAGRAKLIGDVILQHYRKSHPQNGAGEDPQTSPQSTPREKR